MQYDVPGCSGYRRTTRPSVSFKMPGGRLVFSAAAPDLAVELIKQVLVAESRCHRRKANRVTVEDGKQIPAE